MKKKSSCLGRTIKNAFILFFVLIIIGMFGSSKDENNSAATSTKTFTGTDVPVSTATQVPTTKPIAKDDTLVINLEYPKLGQYGKYYTFNENVEKATADDKETIIQCYVPAGEYILTNKGKYPTFVFIYSQQTKITNVGWEEPVDCWSSEMLHVGDSCEISIKEDYYINLQENNVFELVRK